VKDTGRISIQLGAHHAPFAQAPNINAVVVISIATEVFCPIALSRTLRYIPAIAGGTNINKHSGVSDVSWNFDRQ